MNNTIPTKQQLMKKLDSLVEYYQDDGKCYRLTLYVKGIMGDLRWNIKYPENIEIGTIKEEVPFAGY